MNYINLSASARLFVWDTLPDRFKNLKEPFITKLDSLLMRYSKASIEFPGVEPYETENEMISALTAVLDKIVARGNPTICDKVFEDRLLELEALSEFEFSDLQETTNSHLVGKGIKRVPPRIRAEDMIQEAESCFYISYSPGLETHKQNEELPFELKDLASEEEDQFYRLVGEKISHGIQCNLHRQTLISDLIGYDRNEILGSRVDFSLFLKNRKIIIEIDGEDHRSDASIQQHDKVKDEILNKAGWKVLRIPAKEIRSESGGWIEELTAGINNTSDLIGEMDGVYLEERMDSIPFLMVVYPHIVHRTLRAIIQSIRFGQFPLNGEAKVLVIEEDVATVSEAIHQLYELWDNLNSICHKLPEPPSLNIHYIGSEPICPLPKSSKLKLTQKKTPDDKYDLCISHSFGLFTNQEGLLEKRLEGSFEANQYFRIRTAPIQREYRQLLWSPPLTFDLEGLEEALIKQTQDEETNVPEEEFKALTYFLHTIFRKHHFWDGQARVICRLLQGKPAIVLLPTGGGKSLTFQFAGLLTPGVTLVVDPLVALMTDQVENLNLMGFDRAGFISSTLERDQQNIELDKVANGHYYYVFVTPERLQMDEFRKPLRALVAQYPISLAVIDEVHCVSEWGHDFRPSYLHLGRNIEKYCTTPNGFSPTLVGLTGTASFAVLTDVQMQLNVGDEEAIILPRSFDRQELVFHVETVDIKEKESRLQIIKTRMPQDFRRNPQSFFQRRGESTNSGIIFCPHVNGPLGVVQISNILGHRNYYAGGKPKRPEFGYDEWREHKIRVQKNFKYNRIQELVATKSFGMGIDKPNIRYTIHYSIPPSVEAFYQEAGRAGRDGIPQSAHCYVIYSDNNWDIANEIIRERDHRRAIVRINAVRRQDKGDLLVQLWLLYNTYQDRHEEKQNTFQIWSDMLYPEVSEMPVNATNTVTIPFEQDSIREKREKAIFRLVLLGVVEEYSVDWRLRTFEVRAKKIEPKSIREKLKDYFLQYKFKEFSERNTSEIPIDNISQTLEICLDRLIDFVYDEIAEKRKQALRTMAEICRGFESDQQFRDSILVYLQESEFTSILRTWINQPFSNIGFDTIENILSQVEDLEQAKRLVGTTRRMLDEDPSNLALRFLSCCVRSQCDTESDNSVYQECLTLIDHIRDQYEDLPERVEVLIILMDKLQQYRSGIVKTVLEIILRKIGELDFVRTYLRTNQQIDDKLTLVMMFTLLTADSLKATTATEFYQSLYNRRRINGRH